MGVLAGLALGVADLAQPQVRASDAVQVIRSSQESAKVPGAPGAAEPEFVMHARVQDTIELSGIRAAIQHRQVLRIAPILFLAQLDLHSFKEFRARQWV